MSAKSNCFLAAASLVCAAVSDSIATSTLKYAAEVRTIRLSLAESRVKSAALLRSRCERRLANWVKLNSVWLPLMV
ncbi:hypothetical protein D3C72_2047970 [compost metagenome]